MLGKKDKEERENCVEKNIYSLTWCREKKIP